MMMAAKFI